MKKMILNLMLLSYCGASARIQTIFDCKTLDHSATYSGSVSHHNPTVGLVEVDQNAFHADFANGNQTMAVLWKQQDQLIRINLDLLNQTGKLANLSRPSGQNEIQLDCSSQLENP